MSNISYDLIKKALDMSSIRQKMTSSNIANINTPNYKVNRVEFEDILKKAKDGVGMKKTHEKHFGVGDVSDIEAVVSKRRGTSYNDNGNNVDIDLEMTELAANEIYYSVLTRQINSKLGQLNYVINR